MAKIKIMDEILANKIAAGEVVERCASVVKELVENSIDAKSSEIKIELIESGTSSIKVIDNGIGMDKEDAVMSFNRHATSKLKNEDDLFHINTLGFRGEALSSIASVSEVILKTCANNIGTEVKIDGGKIKSVEACESRKGTLIEVKNLFYNTPARLKHMKSLYTELASITDYVNKIALSYPEIKFTLINNGTVLLNTDGSGNLLKVIKAIYGLNITKKMMEVQGSNNDYEITGYISKPEIHRSNRNAMITLVNGRVVKNLELNRTINDSYHSYKPDNRYPVVVLNIKTDPTLVDVNIHPTKMDVKFSKTEELLELVQKIIKDKLENKTLIPHITQQEEKIDNSFKESIYKPHNYEEQVLELDRVSEPTVSYEKEEPEDYIILEDEEKNPEKKRLPELYPVGLVHGTYIICQNETGMYMIDQHAAKERINYEICLRKLSNPDKKNIKLLFPLTIEYSIDEYIVIEKNMDFLREMGFDVDTFGINSVIVKAHPTWLPAGNENEAIKKVFELVISREKNFDLGRFRDHVAATMACKMSIKANENITLEEMENLINDLRKCDNPFNCPHGRPTMVYYTKYDLEKLFKRSGF